MRNRLTRVERFCLYKVPSNVSWCVKASLFVLARYEAIFPVLRLYTLLLLVRCMIIATRFDLCAVTHHRHGYLLVFTVTDGYPPQLIVRLVTSWS